MGFCRPSRGGAPVSTLVYYSPDGFGAWLVRRRCDGEKVIKPKSKSMM